MSHKVTTHWKGNLQFESDNPNGKTVFMDTSTEHGGHNSGLSPKAMMLSALAGCSGLDVIMLLDKMKVKISDFSMDTQGELTDEHPKYYSKVHMIYRFYSAEPKKDKIEKAVQLSIDKYCGVMEMFRQFADVTTEVYLHKQ